MVQFIRQSRHKIAIGQEIIVTGTNSPKIVPVSRLRYDMKVPVTWRGQSATLYFGNWRPSSGKNELATRLFDRSGFVIYGPVTLVTSIATWDCFRVSGKKFQVTDAIENLNLRKDTYVVLPTTRHDKLQDVITNDRNTLLALKMLFS